jgi:hypothetical protein
VKNDSAFKILTAKEISEYFVNNKRFKSFNFNGQFIFLEELQTGKLNLFQCRKTPTDRNFSYYLYYNSSNDFYQIKPLGSWIPVKGNVEFKNKVFTFKAFYTPESAKSYIISLPETSISLKNNINSGFWTISNLELIVREYNSK